MVVNGHDHSKSIHTIETAIYIAEREKMNDVIVLMK